MLSSIPRVLLLAFVQSEICYQTLSPDSMFIPVLLSHLQVCAQLGRDDDSHADVIRNAELQVSFEMLMRKMFSFFPIVVLDKRHLCIL